MADEESKKLLNDWGLAEYVPNFEKNKVTHKIMPFLDESMLKDLIPVIGDRATFNMNCKTNQKDKNTVVFAEYSNIERKRKLGASTSTSNLKCIKVQKENDSNDFFESDTDDADVCENSSLILEHFKSVEAILRSSEKGKNIILNYNRKKKLSPKDRTYVVDLLTTELRKLTKRVNNNILQSLSKRIVEAFPESEILSTYYVPPVKRKESGPLNRSIPARGKIVNKWRNLTNSLKSSEYKDNATFEGNSSVLEETFVDSRVSIQLLLLSYYIPSKAIFKIKSSQSKAKTWKITIGDAKDSIIQHAIVEGDTEVIKEKRIAFALDHKQALQPYIIIVGEELKKIDHVYVCLDKTLYMVSSVIEAIDVCFKSFHVFNLTYPIASKHIWLIIQKCLYKFTTPYDEVLSYTEHIIMELNKNAKKVSSATEHFSDDSSSDKS